MAITEARTPYEFLARWDHTTGTFKGAHIQFYDSVVKDGVVIAGAPSKAFGVGEGMAFPLVDIVDQVTTDALAKVDELTAALDTATAAQTAAEQARDAAIAERDALQAQIAALTPDPNARVVSIDNYRDRFTPTELGAVLQCAYGGNVNCQMLLLKVQTATGGIDLDSQSVIDGLAYLTAIGILAAGRANEIRGV